MKSHLERLEHRDVPAALWQPDMHVGDWVPFPDWSGNVYHLHADVTGPESNGVKVFEDVYFAGEGAGARVLILDGGRAQYVPHYDPVLGEVWSPEDKGRVLFDGLAFGDATARFGLKAAAVTVPDGRDSLWFAWGESDGTDSGLKPGPVLSRLTFDGVGFTRHESLALEESYRGSIQILGMSLLSNLSNRISLSLCTIKW